LQALVKMFRPNALSPNTMTPTANGLDYHLLPDLFQDCLSADAHRRLILERDAWFNGDKRFGPTYSHNMSALKAMGLELGQPQLMEKTERDDRLVEPFDELPGATVGPMKRGRSAHAADQISRAGLFPRMGQADTKAVQVALGGAMTTGSGLSQPGEQSKQAMFYGSGGLYGGHSLRVDESEYDTDEDKAIGRRKRKIKRVTGRSPPSMFQREGDKQVKAEAEESGYVAGPPASMTRHGRWGQSPQGTLGGCTAERVDGTATHTSTSQSIRVSRRTTPKRFMVNKEHLRALAMVAAEVDDL
jgi:hypothetical protein